MNVLAPRLVRAFLAFLGGLLPALRYAPPALPFVAASVAALGLSFHLLSRSRDTASGARASLLLLVGFALAGAATGASGAHATAVDCRALLPDTAPIEIRGVLAANVPAGPESRWIRFPVRADEVRSRGAVVAGCGGEFRVRLPEADEPRLAGSEVRLVGEWLRDAPPIVASAWPRPPRFTGVVAADSATLVASPAFARDPLLWLRGRTGARLHALFPRHAALADALLLGRRELLDPAIRDRFIDSGLIHLLAISGAHVGLLAAMVLVCGRIAAHALGRRGRRIPHLTIGLVLLYLAMIGAPPSAIRAGIMISLALLAKLLQRPAAAAPIVATAAWTIVAFDPIAVLDPGYQLSFAGVIGILSVRGPVLHRLPARVRHAPALRWVVELLIVSVAAFAATAPIAAYHFGRVAPVAIVANLGAMPLTSLALAGIVGATVVATVSLPLAEVVAGGAAVALDLLDWTAARAAAAPYGHGAVARLEAWAVLAAAAALVVALDAAGRLRGRFRWTVASAAAIAVLLAWPSGAATRGGALELHFLDVGQGDATAIRTPAGRWLLVDAGPRVERYDAGERRVLPFLRARGVHRLEALLLTHPDADHIGGAPAVLEGIAVGRLIEPGLAVGRPLYLETLRAAEGRGVAWSAGHSGRTLHVDDVSIELLWPDADLLDSTTEANDISLVALIRFGAFAALLTGDAPSAVEARLVERYGEALRAQLLKAGHHGSRTSTSAALLDAVQPELAVVSAGRRNRYGHPAPEVLARLRERGIEVARTDRDGTVSIRVPAGGAAWMRVAP